MITNPSGAWIDRWFAQFDLLPMSIENGLDFERAKDGLPNLQRFDADAYLVEVEAVLEEAVPIEEHSLEFDQLDAFCDRDLPQNRVGAE